MALRHFLSLYDLSSSELRQIISRAIDLKQGHKSGNIFEPLKNRVLALIFEKSSTRTRVSFESAMAQFGGSSIFLSPDDSQISRGESIEDSAIVLSRMVDAMAIRTFQHDKLVSFAESSTVPVINALTDDYHPCQLLADMQTFYERKGDIQGKKVAWIGDGNNVCKTFMQAATMLDFELAISCPSGFEPNTIDQDQFKQHCHIAASNSIAVEGAELVVTDTWSSMGKESEKETRSKAFKEYQVTPSLMQIAAEGALFMHCLPARRGKEISSDMLTHASSVVWDEAENRLHAQKALLEFLMCNV
jgi:ornithine carbamoyltransferase